MDELNGFIKVYLAQKLAVWFYKSKQNHASKSDFWQMKRAWFCVFVHFILLNLQKLYDYSLKVYHKMNGWLCGIFICRLMWLKVLSCDKTFCFGWVFCWLFVTDFVRAFGKFLSKRWINVNFLQNFATMHTFKGNATCYLLWNGVHYAVDMRLKYSGV